MHFSSFLKDFHGKIYKIYIILEGESPTLTFFNILEHGWILLNVHENAWKYLGKLFWLCQGFSICLIIINIWQASNMKYTSVLNMPWYSYDKIVIIIIIITNFIILEFLFAQFLHLTPPPPPNYFYFLARVRT